MLDIAIVGAGICGLALARTLSKAGFTLALFEARNRLGGRVYSVENPTSGQRLDLGPTWFWPESQPTIAALVDEFGLDSFDQHDPGEVLVMADADAAPVIQSAPRLHGGARRLKGGMAALVEQLAAGFPASTIRLNHVLTQVKDCEDHVALIFDVKGATETVRARRIVFALPPRLVLEQVQFAPALPSDVAARMRETPTWMAAQAKAVVGFSGPPAWRVRGYSGNAFVTHGQAVLGEVFDACDASGEKAALGGFFALTPELRERFRQGLSMLAASQFVQLFGKALENGELHILDWAQESFTCSQEDRACAGATHPDYGDRILAGPMWNGKLYFGGAETARAGGGYVEGALNAAQRIGTQLIEPPNADRPSPAKPDDINRRALERLTQWVSSKQSASFANYRERLTYALSHGQREQLTQRAMLGAMEAVFAEALEVIENLPFCLDGVGVERGRCDLTPRVQAAFNGFIQSLLDAVIDFNRTSCALSNFPQEHRPSKDYVSATLRDIAAAWREFSLAANSLLLAKRAV
ncbi:monoamine oxidase [freshwater sediment metagenome]|uniref:Monoamine oxidase n=1 Tax=freshwater sediment metagenome TaxID=556182 RepID=A0AA48R9E2_9ZZZZ